ncbi:MAG: hypothetical protein F4051_14635 [Boseongicola sp. SB0670_bin_30]|nr:hypothetical protein [Boseongicola sp. SB0670_bin_30]
MMSDALRVEIIDRAGLEREQKRLLPKRDSGQRGGEEQREFIRLAAGDTPEFCDFVRSWGVRKGKKPPVTTVPLSEREFTDPPWSTECAITATWSGLPTSMAARPETWTRINLEMIAQGRIKSSYLAADGNGDSGRTRITKALNGTDPEQVDRCVRAVLRRLGGVIEARANRTAFLDCPLARAWWRNRYSQEAHVTFGRDSVETLSAALRPAFRWEALVEAMVSRLTVIGDSAIRPAVVQCLADGAGGSKREVAEMLRWIGRRSTVQALGALGAEYVQEAISDQFLGLR